jgi:glycosyltransferase 2 family protein
VSLVASHLKVALVFLLKLGLTAACLGWAFSQVDWENSVFVRPGAVDYRWLAAGAGLAGATVFLTALRWWFFLRAQGLPTGIGRATELTMIGNLFNLVSVGGIGGDAARIVLLIRDHPGRKLVITMAVMMDHLAGMVTMAALFFIISAARFEALADQSLLGKGVIRFAWFYLGGGLGVVAFLFICASPPMHRRIHGNGRFARWPVLSRIPEIHDVFRRKWQHTLAGVLVSFVMLFAYFTSFWCGLRAVGGDAPAGTVITAMPVIDSISALPVSVAGVGVREKLFEILMDDLAGVPAETAVAASLAGFACNVLWAACGALFFLKKRDRIQVAELDRVAMPSDGGEAAG